MSNSPPSRRDRSSLQDLAKLASASSLAPVSKTPAPPPASSSDPDHDSGIIDLKVIAALDEGAVARAKSTPLASSPLFENEPDEAPRASASSGRTSAPSSAPSSRPPLAASASGIPSGRLSAPAAGGAALVSSPGSKTALVPPAPASSAASLGGAAPIPGRKGPLPIVLGAVGLLVVGAGILFYAHSSKSAPLADAQGNAAPQPAQPSAGSQVPVAAAPGPSPVDTAPGVGAASTAANGTPDPASVPGNGAANGAEPRGTQTSVVKSGVSTGPAGGRRGSGSAKAAAADGPGASPGVSTVSPLSAMMAEASNSPRTPAVAPSPVAPSPVSAGALGDAVQHAVGATGAAPPVSQASDAPAAPQFAAGTVPEKPSQGAVQGAIGRALPGARSCLNPDDPVSRANITFSSVGSVSAVVVSGSAAGKPAEDCIKSALLKATVPPFSQASYSANVTVRPN